MIASILRKSQRQPSKHTAGGHLQTARTLTAERLLTALDDASVISLPTLAKRCRTSLETLKTKLLVENDLREEVARVLAVRRAVA